MASVPGKMRPSGRHTHVSMLFSGSYLSFHPGHQEQLPASHLHHRTPPYCGFPKDRERVLRASGQLIPHHRLNTSFITGVHKQSVRAKIHPLTFIFIIPHGGEAKQENVFVSNLFCSLALMKGIKINQCF